MIYFQIQTVYLSKYRINLKRIVGMFLRIDQSLEYAEFKRRLCIINREEVKGNNKKLKT